jgi:hypothetical protein
MDDFLLLIPPPLQPLMPEICGDGRKSDNCFSLFNVKCHSEAKQASLSSFLGAYPCRNNCFCMMVVGLWHSPTRRPFEALVEQVTQGNWWGKNIHMVQILFYFNMRSKIFTWIKFKSYREVYTLPPPLASCYSGPCFGINHFYQFVLKKKRGR